jgi:hypothetical protein
MYVCPACQLRCTYTEPDKAVCGGCANLAPPCLEKEKFEDMMCYMAPCVACEITKEWTDQRKEETDVALESKRLRRYADEEPHRDLVVPDIGHVRDLRGRLHRHVRDRQVRLPRP